jgi:cytoskeletal protein CcmA (bactofilin family)
MTGSIFSQGDVNFSGAIEGDIHAADLTIGDTGMIKGELFAQTIVVRGRVEGSIRGRRVQICAGAKVLGDVIYVSLAIEANAVFESIARYSPNPGTGQAGRVLPRISEDYE